MTRSLIMTFLGSYRGHAHPHESPILMTLPLMILSLFAIGAGLFLVNALPEYLANVLPISVEHEHESIVAALIHSWVGVLGIVMAFVFYVFSPAVPKSLYAICPPISKLLQEKFYIDEIYHAAVVQPLSTLSNCLWKKVDVGTIDGMVNGSGAVVDISGEVLRNTQSGQIRSYAFAILLATVAILYFCLLT